MDWINTCTPLLIDPSHLGVWKQMRHLINGELLNPHGNSFSCGFLNSIKSKGLLINAVWENFSCSLIAKALCRTKTRRWLLTNPAQGGSIVIGMFSHTKRALVQGRVPVGLGPQTLSRVLSQKHPEEFCKNAKATSRETAI